MYFKNEFYLNFIVLMLVSSPGFMLLLCNADDANTATTASPLAWVTATIGECQQCSNLTASSTTLTVPAIYSPPTGQVKIFVKRYMRAGATSAPVHLIMLPGGPGQDETTLEPHVGNISNFLNGSAAIYLVDMRMVGQSQNLVPTNSLGWVQEIDQIAQSSPIPLQAISLSNAARDIIELGKSIKVSPEFSSGAILGVYGVSFGASWAFRTLQFDNENVFERGIIDSIAAFDGLISPNNDEDLLANCDSHPSCKEQFGGDAKNARKMLSEILNPSLNDCTAAFGRVIGDDSNFFTLPLALRPYLVLQSLLEGDKSLGNRYHSTQLALAFIKATHLCHDPTSYQQILGEVAGEFGGAARGGLSSSKFTNSLSALVNNNLSLTLKEKGRIKINSILAKAAPSGEMNYLVNHLLFDGEAYNLPNGGSGSSCGSPTLTHQCMLYFVYAETFKQIGAHVPPRDPIASQPPKSTAKIFFIHGQLDLMTPLRPAERLASSISGSRWLTYRNRGHALVSDGECAQPIFREALLGDSSSITDSCLETVNSAPLDWTFKMIPNYRTWFDPSVDWQANYIPDPPQPSISGGLGGSTLLISIVTAIIVICSGGVGVMIWKKRKMAAASTS